MVGPDVSTAIAAPSSLATSKPQAAEGRERGWRHQQQLSGAELRKATPLFLVARSPPLVAMSIPSLTPSPRRPQTASSLTSSRSKSENRKSPNALPPLCPPRTTREHSAHLLPPLFSIAAAVLSVDLCTSASTAMMDTTTGHYKPPTTPHYCHHHPTHSPYHTTTMHNNHPITHALHQHTPHPHPPLYQPLAQLPHHILPVPTITPIQQLPEHVDYCPYTLT